MADSPVSQFIQEFYRRVGRYPTGEEISRFLEAWQRDAAEAITQYPFQQAPPWARPSGQRQTPPPSGQPATRASSPSGGTTFRPATWEEEFERQHGRPPTQEDVEDRLWAEQFERTYGRPPTMDDWRAHWYSRRGLPQPGTGSAAGAASAPPPEQPTVGDLLGLRFPALQTSVPSYIRDWVRYLQETLQANSQRVAPTNPLAVKVEEGKEPTPFQQLQQETARQLGLDATQLADEDLLKGWQDFIDSLMKAPFEAQKSLLRFRWDAEKGWHEVSIPDMPNPREL